jgi:hypothetical protein
VLLRKYSIVEEGKRREQDSKKRKKGRIEENSKK